jgi:hypothetical protein
VFSKVPKHTYEPCAFKTTSVGYSAALKDMELSCPCDGGTHFILLAKFPTSVPLFQKS